VEGLPINLRHKNHWAGELPGYLPGSLWLDPVFQLAVELDLQRIATISTARVDRDG
jgi:hypothetical protein